MRSLYTLYSIAVDNFDSKYVPWGICTYIVYLNELGVIDDKERNRLTTHLHNAKPSKDNKFKRFAKNKHFYGGVHWWERGESGNKQRLLFLKALQEDTKPLHLKFWQYFTKSILKRF